MIEFEIHRVAQFFTRLISNYLCSAFLGLASVRNNNSMPPSAQRNTHHLKFQQTFV